MTFQWRQFLSLAARLAGASTTTESETRTAVGRAYYAAYLESREVAIARGMIFNKNQPSHEQVWQFFRKGGPSGISTYDRAAFKHVGELGIALRARRTQADYYLANPPSATDAKKAVAMSQEILNRIKGL